MRDEVVIDFTTDEAVRTDQRENILYHGKDSFVNVIGLFGSNAAGKSNLIKAVDFCRDLVLKSHLNNEGDALEYERFKFTDDPVSEFGVNFVTEGIEYEYSFALKDGKVLSEELYHFPKGRKALVFKRENGNEFSYRKGVIKRPKEIEGAVGPKTLFISRASSMNRELPQVVYRFFLNELAVGAGSFSFSSLTPERIETDKEVLLRAFEVSDSDIIDVKMEMVSPERYRLLSYHKENPTIAFDFEKEESEGTKRLLFLFLKLMEVFRNKASIFLDEFDLKLHLRLSEFLLDMVRASNGAQMLFTSHNPNLINMDKLRPEQIVIVSKGADGNSDFVPLSDYTDIKDWRDAQKYYLQGRFDGVPYTGNVIEILEALFKK